MRERKPKRQIIGDRDVRIYPGYYEWIIEVSGYDIAVLGDFEGEPPYGDDVVAAIKSREETMVVSKDNPLTNEGEDIDKAIRVLDSLVEGDYKKIAFRWDMVMNYRF